MPAPVAPALLGTYVSYDGGAVYNPPAYYLDGRGMVHLQGMVKNGLGASEIFHLPVGLRPSKKVLNRAMESEGSGEVVADGEVDADGTVLVGGVNGASGPTYTSLDGMCFLAEQ